MDQSVSEAIALALRDAGVGVLTCVPGSGANAVFSAFNRLVTSPRPLSFHEETAYTLSHGAALTGTRSAALMKAHGLVKAGNSVTDSLYCGTTSGFLSLVFSDRQGLQSDSILDIEAFLKGIWIPYETADSPDIYNQIQRLLAESEKRQLPYVLVIDSHELQTSADKPSPPRTEGIPDLDRFYAERPFRRHIRQNVLCPFFVEYQYRVLRSKLDRQDWSAIPVPESPRLPESLPDKWKAAFTLYELLFDVFKNIRGPVVCGDTGISTLFACEPYNGIDITTFMGGSLPLAVGACLSGYTNVWAVTGDFAFIAAGHLGLLEARQRGLPLRVLLLDNGKAETTGGQPVPAGLLPELLESYRQFRLDIHNPQDRAEVESILTRASQSPDLSIVVAHYRA